jgi:hypothetical protein
MELGNNLNEDIYGSIRMAGILHRTVLSSVTSLNHISVYYLVNNSIRKPVENSVGILARSIIITYMGNGIR